MLVYFFRLEKLSQPLNKYPLLEEMLALRALGWSYTTLSDKYSVPKTTIRYLCRRFGLSGNTKTTYIRTSRTTTAMPPELYTDEERINPGKSYAEYLRDERERKWRRLTQSHLRKEL